MPGVQWKAHDVTKARQLRAQGMMFKDIARQFEGRSAQSIRFILKQYGRPTKKQRYHAMLNPVAVPDPLLPALARSIGRYANDNGICLTEALNRLLCGGMAR